MTRNKSATAKQKIISDVDDLAKMIADIAKFRGVHFKPDAKKVEMFRPNRQHSVRSSEDFGQDGMHV